MGTYELNKKALDLAQQVGIKLIIGDNRIQPGKPVDEAALKKLDQVVRDYKGFPALLGYFIVDEPNAATFRNMAMIKKQISLHDPLHGLTIHGAGANMIPGFRRAMTCAYMPSVFVFLSRLMMHKEE